jgi:hypothetical protein
MVQLAVAYVVTKVIKQSGVQQRFIVLTSHIVITAWGFDVMQNIAVITPISHIPIRVMNFSKLSDFWWEAVF